MLKQDERCFKIGEIYLMNFSGRESEQCGLRPGLVFQNNVGNAHSPNVIALPLTSSLKKSGQPTHVIIPASNDGLKRDSMVLCENPERMSKERIGSYITTLDDDYMQQVVVGNLLATSAISFISPEMLYAVWQKAKVLNE